MPLRAAGIVMYRRTRGALEVLLVHPGGPFWAEKDVGAWSIPKGKVEEGEEVRAAALREFREETGSEAQGEMILLTPVRQRSGKVVHAWAVEGTLDASGVRSNTFSMEWPPRSGVVAEYPEIDRAEFFAMAEARRRIHPYQRPLLEELERMMGAGSA